MNFKLLILVFVLCFSAASQAAWPRCLRWILPAEKVPEVKQVVEGPASTGVQALMAVGLETKDAEKMTEILGVEGVAALLSKIGEPLTFKRDNRSFAKLTVTRAEALAVFGRIFYSIGVARGKMGRLNPDWFEGAEIAGGKDGNSKTLYLDGGILRSVVIGEGDNVDFWIMNGSQALLDTQILNLSHIPGTIEEKSP